MRPLFDHSLLRDLPGAYLRTRPFPAPAPALVIYNNALAEALELPPEIAANAAAWLSGAEVPPGADPVALAYAGHQFGGFSPQLGDGRAHLLGEMVTPLGRFDLQLKGSGRTAFSRGGDGKAALGPMLREYLVSEAMQALGAPTTRSLAVVTTGEEVLRDSGPLPGAVLARVAASHLRVGTFQFFAARGDVAMLRRLTDHAIARHDPDLAPGDALGLWQRVADRQIRLVAQWMGLGFVHGVMNTDNMALSGETIDYGPCAFMDRYDPQMVFSSIDRQGRYGFSNQAPIMGWNLARLAEALLPLLDVKEDRAVDLANARLEQVMPAFEAEWHRVMAAKLGLPAEVGAEAQGLIGDWMRLIEGKDWTQTHQLLTRIASGAADPASLGAVLGGADQAAGWVARWQGLRCRPGGAGAAATALAAGMARANPVVIPRNHLVEAALTEANAGEMAAFHALLDQVRRPHDPPTGREAYALPPPEGFGPYVTFCGT